MILIVYILYNRFYVGFEFNRIQFKICIDLVGGFESLLENGMSKEKVELRYGKMEKVYFYGSV